MGTDSTTPTADTTARSLVVAGRYVGVSSVATTATESAAAVVSESAAEMTTELIIGSITHRSDWDEFDGHAAFLRNECEKLLHEFFGERCSVFELNCECCKRWSAYDALVENPFEKPSPQQK